MNKNIYTIILFFVHIFTANRHQMCYT